MDKELNSSKNFNTEFTNTKDSNDYQNLMNTKKITSLFICDKKIPLGIVHIHDLLRLTS